MPAQLPDKRIPQPEPVGSLKPASRQPVFASRHGSVLTTRDSRLTTRGSRRAYTLAETLVTMIMFALISAATSVALNTAIRAQQAASRKAAQIDTARAALATITRDVRLAYAAADNPNTFFLASGNGVGPLVQFTSRSHHVTVPPADQNGHAQPDQTAQPQSDVAIIEYDFDPQTGQLTRTETAVPNTDSLSSQTQPAPGNVIARHVESVTFQFVDPNQGLRPDWNYASPQPGQTPTGTAGQAGAGGQSAAANENVNASGTAGDTSLPIAVQVTLVIAGQHGPPDTYSTTIPLEMVTPQPTGQKPASTTGTAGGTTGGTTPGGTSGGTNPGGGTTGGNTGGGRPGGTTTGGTAGGSGGVSLPGLPTTGGARP